MLMLYSILHRHIQIYAEIYKHNIRTSMNERIHFFIKIYLSHFILERVDVGCVRDELETGTDCYIDAAVLLSHLGWVAQPWVTEGPKPSVCRWFSIRHLVSKWLKPSVCCLYYCLTSTCYRCSSAVLLLFFRLFTQVHLLIDGSVEGQYVTFKRNGITFFIHS